jgi:hypothetical protein
MFPGNQMQGSPRMDMMTGADMATKKQGGMPAIDPRLQNFAASFGNKPGSPSQPQPKAENPNAQAQDEKKMRMALVRSMGKPASMAKSLTPEEVDMHIQELERQKQALFGGGEEPEDNMETAMGGGQPNPFGAA